MEAFPQLLNGFSVALTPMNLLWCLVGTTLGTAIGVLPGLGPALTIALLLPITFKVEPTAALMLFADHYYGAMYGGSITSILLNPPGETASGINVMVVAVGLLAGGETLYVASRYRSGKDEIIPLSGSLWMTREEWKRSWKPWLRGAAIGFPIGAMPAGGAEIPTFLSYYVEKKLSSKPQEFGKGAIEGVAGPEAANNASAAGVLVPMLTLGLPTSATAAIMLSAFQSYGINPGPLLFESQPQLVWGLIASLFIGNVMLLVLNLPMIAIWVKLLQIPALAALALVGPKLYDLAMKPKPDHVPGDA